MDIELVKTEIEMEIDTEREGESSIQFTPQMAVTARVDRFRLQPRARSLLCLP